MANSIIYYDFFRCLNYLASFEMRLLRMMVTSIWARKCINVIIERYLCHSNAIYLRHMKNADASNVRVYGISRNQPESAGDSASGLDASGDDIYVGQAGVGERAGIGEQRACLVRCFAFDDYAC